MRNSHAGRALRRSPTMGRLSGEDFMRARYAAVIGIAALLSATALTPTVFAQDAPLLSTATAADLAKRVVIRRDTYGVPHILAEDDEAAAFGMGFAAAEDHAVEMGKQYLGVRGEAARWFGPEFL